MTLRRHWLRLGDLYVHARVARPDSAIGLPIVLVHGLGVSGAYMEPLARELGRDRQVLAPDLPGFGRSERPAEPLGLEGLGDALAGIMQAAGISRAALFGNSFGCQIAVDLALRRPALVERLVLNGPTVDPDGRSALRQVLRLLADAPFEPLPLVAISVRDYLRAGPRHTWRAFRQMLADPIEDKLPRVEIPTLVIRGARDPIVPQRWAQEVARLLPRGRLVAVSGVAHAANFDAPRRIATLVRAFLGDER